MPILFAESWDAKKHEWRIEKPPTLQDGLKKINVLLRVKKDIKKRLITVSFDHEQAETAKKIVDLYLTELSTSLREEVLQDATENMRFFREQLERSTDPILKEKIYALLAKEIEKETFAKAQKYYGFLVIDPPIAPDMDKKVKPKRSLICILSVFAAFFIAVFVALAIEFIRRIKTDDPKRFAQISNELKLFHVGSKTRKKVEAGI
jgi:uncharacterized protein involved in exopolysaccharide biosynthesis